ncbi:MAG: hypothetical protein HFH31_01455 [Bacilli bacterium]|nr:hypothetical protein [Bacilli bacterium]
MFDDSSSNYQFSKKSNILFYMMVTELNYSHRGSFSYARNFIELHERVKDMIGQEEYKQKVYKGVTSYMSEANDDNELIKLSR